MTKRWGESGNIFFTLFGAVALVGVVGAATSTLMRGPVGTVVSLNQRAKADSQMQIAMKLAMLESQQRDPTGPAPPDCDSDGLIEPMQPGPAIVGLGGGGQLPSVGSTTNDPWGRPYGYCGWNHGTQFGPITETSNTCATTVPADPGLLDGLQGASGVVIAIISAGPDREFGTTCNAAPADLASTFTRGPNGADDIIVNMTYAEANQASGGLWYLSSGNPDQITTGMELDVQQGAQFSSSDVSFQSDARFGGAVDLRNDVSNPNAGWFFLPDQTGLLDSDCGAATSATNAGAMRRKTSGGSQVLQICDPNDTDPVVDLYWADIGGAGAIVAAAGNPGEIQYNDAGVMGANAALRFNSSGGLSTTGDSTFGADVDVSSDLDVGGALDVTGVTTLTGTLNADGAADFDSTIDVALDATFGSTLRGAVGSNATPTYTFTGATSSGMYYSSGGLMFSVGGTDEASITAAGTTVRNLSVTSSASVTNNLTVGGVLTTGSLTVNDDITADRFISRMATTSAALPGFETEPGTGLFSSADNVLSLVTGGASQVVVNAAGDVGIGVPVPNTRLDVDGAIKISTTAAICGPALHGAIRYFSGDLLQVCSSLTNVWEDIGTSGGGGGGAASYWTRISAVDRRLYYTDDFVGVGTNDPLDNFHVNGDLLVTGTVGAPSAAVSGAGTRMFFDPEGAAFRGGVVTGNQWDSGNIGLGSFAWGYNAQASGASSFVVGTDVSTTAAGLGGSALGREVVVDGLRATAWSLGDASGVFPRVSGVESFGLFMGDQGGVNLAQANTMALLGGRFLVDQTPPANPAVSGTLSLDVEGGVGAVQYCDEDGVNCFTAASVATGGVGAPGTNREVIFNSNGVLGTDPRFTFSSAGNLTLGGTGAIALPVGDGTNRPAVPANGMIRYNSISGKFEGYQGGGWYDIITTGGGGMAIDDLSDAITNYTSSYNMFLGDGSGVNVSSGIDNTALGQNALAALTQGNSNVAIGGGALEATTTGLSNTALGYAALTKNINGSSNVAIGTTAMFENLSGGNNTAIGVYSLYDNQSGSSNIAIGVASLESNVTGVQNTAIGVNSLALSAGNNNTGIGFQAGDNITTGSFNLVIGHDLDVPNPTDDYQLNIGNFLTGQMDEGFLAINGTGALALPIGNNANRPLAPYNGMIRYNSTSNKFEGYQAGAWQDILTSAVVGGAAAPNRGIQFNSGGNFAASSNLIYSSQGTLMVSGTYTGTPVLPASGAGARMFYDPESASFRAGAVSGAQWDSAQIGDYSTAFGYNSTASGNMSFAIGHAVAAGGYASAAFGQTTEAIGDHSVAYGLGSAAGVIPRVSGARSYGIFMSDQSGINLTANNTMGLFGGRFVMDPRVPAQQLTPRADMDLGASTDAILLPIGQIANRPAAPVNGMLRYNSVSGRFEGYQGGAWQDILTSAVAGGAAAPDRGIQFNSGGNFAADANLIFSSTGDLMVSGTYTGTASVPASGVGTRMFFDVQKGAFRAGQVTATEWNNANIGNNSVALGYATTASGADSFASGHGSIAGGTRSTAFGYFANATGLNATAMGMNTQAHGNNSTATGSFTMASGYNATAMGYRAEVGDGNYASGLGDGSMGIGLIDPDNTTISVNPRITGTQSLGIFMGDQDGLVMTANNTMGLFGGRFVMDPRVPAQQLTPRADMDLGASTDAILLPIGQIANRPAAPVNGMLRYNSVSGKFEGYQAGAWQDILTSGGGAIAIDDLTDAETDYTTDYNLFMGNNAGIGIVAGAQYNTALGINAFDAALTNAADYNTAFGYNSLTANTSGSDNVAIGYGTLAGNQSGRWNVGLGVDALATGNNNDGNTAIGYESLTGTVSGDYNTALGFESLRGNAGSGNVAVGSNVLEVTTGSNNTAIGGNAGDALTTGSENILIGSSVNAINASGDYQLNIGNLLTGTLNAGLLSVNGTGAITVPVGVTGNRPAGLDGMIRYNSLTQRFEGHQAGTWQDLVTVGTAIGAAAPNRGIQFNSGGNFAASTNFLWDDANWNLQIGNIVDTVPEMMIGRTTDDAHIRLQGQAAQNNAIVSMVSDTTGNLWQMTLKGDSSANPDVLAFENYHFADTSWHGPISFSGANGVSRMGINTYSPSVSLDIQATDAIQLPSGGNAYRPSSPANGMLRYNSVSNRFEGYQAGSWQDIITGAASSSIDSLTDAITNYTSGNMFLGQNSGSAITTGGNNTGLGTNALMSNNTGTNNTAYGYQALIANSDGTENTAIGGLALNNNQSGANNTALGYGALFSNIDKSDSTAVGYASMFYADSGGAIPTYNTAVGTYSLRGSTTAANNTGQYNSALGHSSLMNNTSGNDNVSLGSEAMLANTTGNNNVAVGSAALDANTTGNENVAIGIAALGSANNINNTAVGAYALHEATGQDNTAIGKGTLSGTNITGNGNTAIGSGALAGDNITGNNNTALGWGAGQNLTSGSNNIAIGHNVNLSSATSSYQLNIGNLITGTTNAGLMQIVGTGALTLPIGQTGNRPTGVNGMLRYNSQTARFEGYQAGAWQDIVTGAAVGSINDLTDAATNYTSGNMYLGQGAGATVGTNAESNVALGRNALNLHLEGNWNTAIGDLALANLGGVGLRFANTALGTGAGEQLTVGNNNVMLGAFAMSGMSGGEGNVAVGVSAMNWNGGGTGDYNVAVGQEAMNLLNGGADNVAIGRRAADNLTSGSNNITIGSGIDVASATGNYQLNIGNALTGTMNTGLYQFNGTGALTLPIGQTGNRPGAPVNGMLRYNSQTNKFEGYQGGTWADILTGAATVTFLSLTDTPSSYTGEGGKFVRVNTGATALEFTDQLVPSYAGQPAPNAINLDHLGDVVVATPTAGQILTYSGGQWINAAASGSGLAASPNRGIQFNNSGSFGASGNLTFSSSGALDVRTSTGGNTSILDLRQTNGGGNAASISFYNNTSTLTGQIRGWDASIDLVAVGNTRDISIVKEGTTGNSVLSNLYLSRYSTGGAGANGIGSSIVSNLESATDGTYRDGSQIQTVATNAAAASFTTRLTMFPYYNAAVTNGMTLLGASTGTLVGINTTTPVVGLDINTTDALLMPRGDTAQRPGSPINGMLRYNSQTGKFEGYQAGAWMDIITAGGTAASPDRGIQFNSGGAFTASANFTYTSAGRLGIGEATPGAFIHIDTALTSANPLRIDNTFANGPTLRMEQDSGGMKIITDATSGIYPNNDAANLTLASSRCSGEFDYCRTGLMVWNSTGNISLIGGNNAKTLGMERNIYSQAGYDFSIYAGGAASGTSNLNGGTLNLEGGIATGNGMSSIAFRTVMPNQGTGTTARNPSTAMTLASNALTLPSGITAERPGSAGMQAAVNGMIRYNSQTGKFEGYQGGVWTDIITAGGSAASPSGGVQYNSGGSFAASSNFTWNNSTNALNVTGTVNVSNRINIAGTAGNAPVYMNLDALSDAVITSPTAGQVLTYSGGQWINGTASASASAASPDRGIQFNSGGSFAASTALTYTSTGSLVLGAPLNNGIVPIVVTNSASQEIFAVANSYDNGRMWLYDSGNVQRHEFNSWNVSGPYHGIHGEAKADNTYAGANLALTLGNGAGAENGIYMGDNGNNDWSQPAATAIVYYDTSAGGYAYGGLRFKTNATGTAGGLTTRMQIDQNGLISFTSTGAVALNAGTTAQRPASAVNGMLRYNSTTNRFEGYQAGSWQDIVTGAASGVSFITLTDAPSSYAGAGGRFVRVNSGATALEFTDQIVTSVTGQPAPTAPSIDYLGDVTITSATAGQILTYSGGQWVNGTASSSSMIDGLGDAETDYTTDFNMFLGVERLPSATGQYNLGLGQNAGDSITTGDRNIAIGYNALTAMTTTLDNIAIGYNALAVSTSNDQNIAIGARTLDSMISGFTNVAIGTDAMTANVNGGDNVALGHNAMAQGTTGSKNIGLGAQALRDTLGTSNIGIGYNAAGNSDTASYSIAIGEGSLLNNDGNNNIAIGFQAGNGISTGASNILLGYDVDTPTATTSNYMNIGNFLLGEMSNGIAYVSATGGFVVPRGTTAQRPTGVNGMLRYNSQTGKFEGYQAGVWQDIITNSAVTTFLSLTDTPSSYAGQGNRIVRVNSGATALEFTDQVVPSVTGQPAPTNTILDDLGDVVIASPTAGQILTYSGGSWINGTASGGGGAASPDRGIQFNSGGSFTASSSLMFSSTNSLLVAGGSASIPGYSLVGDTDTGVFSNTANTLEFSAGGVQVLELGTTASAVNYIRMVPGATGASPTIINVGSDTTGNGLGLNIYGKNSSLATGDGGPINVIGGSSGANGNGGDVRVQGGFSSGGTGTFGGDLTLAGGDSFDGDAGSVTIRSGVADFLSGFGGGAGGNVSIIGSNGIGSVSAGLNHNGGSVDITAGTGAGTGNSGSVTLTAGTGNTLATSGFINIASGLRLSSDVTSAALGASQNNYLPTNGYTASVYRLTSTTPINITGLEGGIDGRVLTLMNVGTNTITLVDESASSTAGNRFALTQNLSLAQDQSTILIYDSTSTRWRIFGADGLGGGGTPAGATTQIQFNSGGSFAASSNLAYSAVDGLQVGWGAAPTYFDAAITAYASSSGDLFRWGPVHASSATMAGYLGYDGGTSVIDMTINNGHFEQVMGGYTNSAHNYRIYKGYNTATIDSVMQMYRFNNNGAGANGIGAAYDTYLESTTSTNVLSSRLQTVATNAVAANFTTRMDLIPYYNAAATTGMSVLGSAAGTYVGINKTAPVAALDVTGDIQYTGTITDVSDMRLKNNIHQLNDRGSMLDKLDQIGTYSFTMKDDKEGQVEFGVMAQEINKVFPELVKVDDSTAAQYMSVNYVGLIAPLIEASKELKAENEELKTQVSTIEQRMAALEGDMNGMKAHTGYGISKAQMGLGMLIGMMLMAGLSGAVMLVVSRRRRQG